MGTSRTHVVHVPGAQCHTHIQVVHLYTHFAIPSALAPVSRYARAQPRERASLFRARSLDHHVRELRRVLILLIEAVATLGLAAQVALVAAEEALGRTYDG